MRNALLVIFSLLFVVALSVSGSIAQDLMQPNLPEAAKARLGKGTIFDMAYSPDGNRLAVAGGIGIWLYDAGTGAESDLLTGHTRFVTSVAYSPDGSTLASSGGWSDYTIWLWDVHTGQHLQTLDGHTGPVHTAAFSPEGGTLASASYDGTIQLWDVHIGQHLQTLEGHTGPVYAAVFSPDGGTLASASYDGTIRLWNARSGEYQQTLEGHMGWVTTVAFSPDGGTLASGSIDGTILLWDLRRITTWGDIKRTAVVDGARQSLELSPSATPLTPMETALLANYPNPFNPETWIPYQLEKPAEVVLTIYDMSGERVRTLVAGHQPAGVYHSRSRAAYWDGRNQQGEPVANGVYFCTLKAGNFIATRKMLVGK